MDYIHDLRKEIGPRKIILNCAGALIIRDGRILFQRRTDNGRWGLIGGLLEMNETYQQAALREIREETGLEVRLDHFLGIFHNHNIMNCGSSGGRRSRSSSRRTISRRWKLISGVCAGRCCRRMCTKRTTDAGTKRVVHIVPGLHRSRKERKAMPVSFESDYIAGAHPEILRRLAETNLESLPGYGADPYCESAKKKILEACGLEQGEVEFLTGGTQANAVVISTMLADHEGVVAAATGHISSHEAGAIEYTGHEVLELPQENGKIRPETLRRFLSDFFADGNHDHMTFPGMVYLSWPTEYGTLYTKEELEAVSGICREYGIPLFLDGARLAYGLMSRSAE